VSRQRFIYPETFASEDFVALSLGARLLFIGMFATADDYGRGKGSLGVLKATVYPEDDLTREQIGTWTEEVRKRRMVRFYEVDGSIYYEVTKWEKWQRPKYKAASKIPPCPRNSGKLPGLGPDSGTVQPGTRAEPGRSPATGSNRVGLGSVGKGGVGRPPVDPTSELDATDPLPVEISDPEPDEAGPAPEVIRPDYADGLAALRRIARIPDETPA
jgi:hypothetical protein